MQRIKNDFYPTESALTQLLLKHAPICGTVFEPCVGDGAIASVLWQHSHVNRISTNDIVRKKGSSCFDAADPTLFSGAFQFDPSPDWIVTNPPYSQPTCQQIIQNSWDNCWVGIAMLLRLTYLEPCNGRAEFLKSAPLSHLIILNPRPQFRSDTKGTDSTTSAWFVWQKQHRGYTQVIYETDWRSDSRQRDLVYLEAIT